MNTTDPLDLLTAARPTDDSLEATWTSTRSEASFARLSQLGDDTRTIPSRVVVAPRRRSTRRWAALGAAAAVAAVATFGVTSILMPNDSLPQASAIERLATAAAAAPSTTIADGQFIHITLISTQARRDANAPAQDTTIDQWVGSDGTTWSRHVSRVPATGTAYYQFPPLPDGDLFLAARPSDYAQWPTDPARLKAFLDARITPKEGSNDVSQGIFENLSDRFGSGLTPADLNAAMIRVLGALPQVTTSNVTYDGHEAVRLEYRGDYVEALFFDRDSAQFLGETQSAFEMKVSAPEVVTEVPADVVKNAKVEGNGGNEDSPASVNSN